MDQSPLISAAGRRARRQRQPWARLLQAVLDLAGPDAELIRHIERDWVSATFTGSRHAITLRFTGGAAAACGEQFIIALPDHGFELPRWLVADATITAVEDNRLPVRTLVVEAQLLVLADA